MMQSCIYTGEVRHRRYLPRSHVFNYSLFMMYLDLDELDTIFHGRWLWSKDRIALARFRREDHLGDPKQPLSEAVRDAVEKHTKIRPAGPIRLLTHLRYFGFVINPVSFYYCFSQDGTQIETVLLEVHNTPWNEQHVYIEQISENDANRTSLKLNFSKVFHVSPFMAMEMNYQGIMNKPGNSLVVHLENIEHNLKIFDATLMMKRKAITTASLNSMLFLFPFMTMKVLFAIYFEALRLWWKKIPYCPHPGTSATTREHDVK